jgi:hypothetical protein
LIAVVGQPLSGERHSTPGAMRRLGCPPVASAPSRMKRSASETFWTRKPLRLSFRGSSAWDWPAVWIVPEWSAQ